MVDSLYSPLIKKCNFFLTPQQVAQVCRDESYRFFLVSGAKDRYAYAGWSPLCTLWLYPRFFDYSTKTNIRLPLQSLADLNTYLKPLPFLPTDFFISGWVGALTYEASCFADSCFPQRTLSDHSLLGFWGLYDPVIGWDLHHRTMWISSWGLKSDGSYQHELAEQRVSALHALLLEQFSNGSPAFCREDLNMKSPIYFDCNFTRTQYNEAFQKTLNYIQAGDVYQINLSQQFRLCDVEARQLEIFFWKQVQHYEVPFAGLFDLGEQKIVSFSPEEFITLKERKIQTVPIKGTFHAQNKNSFLMGQSKEAAELLMIVDLERNDLAKICLPATVTVSEWKTNEKFQSWQHAMAKVQGVLNPEVGFLEVLQALFPGGSITGAPKRRAMQIIQELEPDSRGFYTGVMGFYDPSGFSRMNILIRTFQWTSKKVLYGAGGGIVAESDAEAEYEETLLKAKPFFDFVSFLKEDLYR